MRVFIASDSFKGCMTSKSANEMMARGIHRADGSIETDLFVISDGGEGMTEAFASAFDAKKSTMKTVDLYGRGIHVLWAFDEKTQTACVDAAGMLGLTLYPRESRHVLDASSKGLGLVCREILKNRKVKRLVIGLGGTGTNDGGMGFAQAFGMVFYDQNHKVLSACAANLSRIAFIDKRRFTLPGDVELIAACDVSNHLLGSKGATHVYGRQKGLKPQQIVRIEEGMRQLNAKIIQTFHVDVNQLAGSGAAGGLGGMLCGPFGARMMSGIEVLEKGSTMIERMKKADYLFTGEGQSDAQSAYGKVVSRIGQIGKELDIPVIDVSGAIGLGAEKLYDQGVDAIFSTADRAMTFQSALRHGPEKLENATFNIMRLILAAERKTRHELETAD